MKNKTFIILLALISGNTSCKKEKNNNGTLNVLTYNIAGLPEGISASHPATYTSVIALLLNNYDIAQVQEDFNYHDTLLQYVTHPYISATSGTVTYGDGLNTFSKYPISNLYREAWTSCSGFDCYTPKGFSYSQVEIKPGVFIDFYNVHANASSNETALAARRANMVQLTEYIKNHSQDKAVIVMGDFNCRYTRLGDTIRLMFDLGFKDAWVEKIRMGDVPVKGSPELSDCDPDRNTALCEKKDKVFYRNNSQVTLTPDHYQLDDTKFYYQDNDTLPLSDHWPLYVRFNYCIR